MPLRKRDLAAVPRKGGGSWRLGGKVRRDGCGDVEGHR